MTVYRYNSDYQYNPEPEKGNKNTGRVSVKTSSSQNLGKKAFLAVYLPGLLVLVMALFGKVFFPCETAGYSEGMFGCDSKVANDYAALTYLPTLLHFFAIPVSFIMGIIAFVKGSGPGWGFLALLPLPIWFAIWGIGDMISSVSS